MRKYRGSSRIKLIKKCGTMSRMLDKKMVPSWLCGELGDGELGVWRIGCDELGSGELGGDEMYRTPNFCKAGNYVAANL